MEKLNFFGGLVIGNKDFILCVKNRKGVISFVGGVYSGTDVYKWREPQGFYDILDPVKKFQKFKEAFEGIFRQGETVLYVPKPNEAQVFYNEFISDEIKKCPHKFHTMIEAMEESGKIVYRDLQFLYEENCDGGHKKIFFTTNTYIYPKITDGKIKYELVTEENFEQGKFPIPGKDLFCKDPEIEVANMEVFVAEIFESFATGGEISEKFGRGAHREALKTFLSKYYSEKEDALKLLVIK